MEVVDELDLFDVLEYEVTHCFRLWLREGERAGESFRAWVFLRTSISMGETVVTVEVDSRISVITTKPLASP